MKAWLVVLALLLLPSASAHGTPAPREFETRLLEDTTSGGDYGGPDGSLGGGIDLLALDVYEGTLPGTATPAAVFRTVFRGGEAGDHRIDVHAVAAGADVTLEFATRDLETFTSTTFDVVRGPVDVGDGHQRALEGVVALSRLGIAPGQAITDIRLEAHHDDEPQDDMPGSWYLHGQKVPLPPTEEEQPPGEYSTTGPAEFFTATADTQIVPLGGQATITLELASTLQESDQTLALRATAPAGINVTFASDLVSLPAGANATAAFTVSGTALGTVQVLVESDLGTARQLTFPLDGAGRIGTGSDIDSKDIAPGQSFQYTFTAPGVFEYHCHPHPWMVATITIGEAANDSVPETHVVRIVEARDSKDWGFEPDELAIRAGDTVVWVNDGATVHTIMGSTGVGGGHDGHDHDHSHPEEKKTPAPLVLVLLGLAVALRRR